MLFVLIYGIIYRGLNYKLDFGLIIFGIINCCNGIALLENVISLALVVNSQRLVCIFIKKID
jgi:hypothetical protein